MSCRVRSLPLDVADAGVHLHQQDGGQRSLLDALLPLRSNVQIFGSTRMYT